MNRSPSASSVSAMLTVTNSRARAELYASTSREDARVSQAEAQHYLLKKFGLDIDAGAHPLAPTPRQAVALSVSVSVSVSVSSRRAVCTEFVARLWEEEELDRAETIDRARLLVLFSEEMELGELAGENAAELAMEEAQHVIEKRRRVGSAGRDAQNPPMRPPRRVRDDGQPHQLG